jgi:cobalt-zinc-cadmium efflux system membrane fusion protein
MDTDVTNDLRKTASELVERAWPVRKQMRLVAVVAAVAAGAIALSWVVTSFRSGASPAPTQDATGSTLRLSEEQLMGLQIDTVATLPFRNEVVADGKIALNADTVTQVFSPYSGRVTKVIAGVGERVEHGAPLLAIEASEFAQSQGDLLTAASQLKLARINAERRHAAYEAKGGSLQDWQQAQADLVVAESTLTLARHRLRILGKTDNEISSLEREGAPEPIAHVAAPISGIVTDRQVGPGQYLEAGSSTPLYTIGDLSTVWLVANVREADAPFIEVGQNVEVHVLALPDRALRATLTAIGTSVDPVTRRVPVRATLDNPDGKLKQDMFATFTIVTSAETMAPAVAEEAIIREGDTARVWILDNGTLALRPIKTGRVSHGMVEVVEGLRAGEQVVTRGSLFIDRAAQPT